MVYFVMFTIDPKHDFNAAMAKFLARIRELKFDMLIMTLGGYLLENTKNATEVREDIRSALPAATPLLVTRLQGDWSGSNLGVVPDRVRWINDKQIKHS